MAAAAANGDDEIREQIKINKYVKWKSRALTWRA